MLEKMLEKNLLLASVIALLFQIQPKFSTELRSPFNEGQVYQYGKAAIPLVRVKVACGYAVAATVASRSFQSFQNLGEFYARPNPL